MQNDLFTENEPLRIAAVSGSLNDWIKIENETDLPKDDYCGKVEFKLKETGECIVGYYDDVYQTFEDDETDKSKDCIVFIDDVECYRYVSDSE